MDTITIELLDPNNITTAERWFMGNGFDYQKDIDNQLSYTINSGIPDFVESMTAYFRANMIPFILSDQDGGVIDQSTSYNSRSFLKTSAYDQLARNLGNF